MRQEIKNYFLTFIKLNKKGLILALLFFVIFGLIFSPQPTWAQIPGFSCGVFDPFCWLANAILSVMVKIVVLIFFGIPLLLSAVFVGIMALILGWIISPDFISLKFTQNAFVNTGLSITRNFANMGFIVFLVAIALATALRIEEYKAKKTLPILILIALLVNFSPVFCGFIIDASNIVMNFFLNGVTGLTGFSNFLMQSGQAMWNLIITAGFDLWTNISAAMQIIIMIVFNFFAGFIFILFSALFIMRYIMLWILVILSPIAFVSYILPATRRGGSLLSWQKWWEQLIAWSIIGIIAGFFLYLGFTMISMINANINAFVCRPGDPNCGPGGLGLMNNILPYLIPLVLLWIAYRETKRTSAMFAKEAIEMPGKIAKVAGQVAIIAATAGAGAGAAAGVLGKAAAGAQRLETTLGKVPILGKPLKYGVGKPISWATRGVEAVAAPPLLEYAEKARRVPGKELQKIDDMSGPEAEAYVNAKTSLLPQPIKSQWRAQYMAKMADKEILEFTSPEFQKEAKAVRASIFEKENPYFQKEAHSIRKALGDMGEEELVHSKLVGLTGTDRDEKEKEIKEEIKKTKGIIQERLGDKGITIEAGLKLKYITKEEVDKDKVAATAKAKAKLTAEEITQFLTDTAAAATDVKELKPEDIRKIIKPDTLATRIGLTLGNPRNLQKIQDSFGHKKLKDVIEGRGGLNDATNTPEKLDEYARKINPAMARSILTSPAYREIEIEARRHMLNPSGQPTISPAAFEKRRRVLEILEEEPKLSRFDKLQLKERKYRERIEELRKRGQPTTYWENRLATEQQRVATLRQKIERIKRLREKWEEIERLKKTAEKRTLK